MKKRIWLGALGGALGGLVMKVFVECFDRNSFGLSARTDARTAHEIWRRVGGGSLNERDAERIGAALHYVFSIAAGAAYAATGSSLRLVRAGHGTAFGAVLWLIGDELAVTLAGLEDPGQTAAFSHLSALAAHIAYGMVVESLVDPLPVT